MNKKFGFTLAEVLITLAIIGVVAALTLPTLMQNYKKKEVETKLMRFYSTMQQAVKTSTVDNGPTEGWAPFGDSSNTITTSNDVLDWYNKYLGSYLHVSKVEVGPGNRGVFVYFLDGSVLRVEGNIYDMDYYITSKCITDDNCQLGKNVFLFRFQPVLKVTPTAVHKYVVNPNIEPYTYAWDGTFEGAKYSGRNGCFEDGALCTKLIQLNGWKIPNDYPYKF